MSKNTNVIEPDKKGFRAADESGALVPSRILLIEYLQGIQQGVTIEALCQHFGLKTEAEEKALESRLTRLLRRGLFDQFTDGKYKVSTVDLVIGVVQGHVGGYGFVVPDEGGDDLYLHYKQMRKVFHGDRVLSKVKKGSHRGRVEGVIIEVFVDDQREIVGQYHREDGVGFVTPQDKRFARDIFVEDADSQKATPGDIVVIKVIDHPVQSFEPKGKVIEIMGQDLSPGMETDIALKNHSIPHVWPKDVIRQLDGMAALIKSVRKTKERRDLRKKRPVTIDGSDARDFDDAVFCERNKNGWQLIVAIADVSHYVPVGSALDQEALNRGNSVYFPNRVVPMLPEALSTGICSLNPKEDRHCLVCDIQIDNLGGVEDFVFYPGIMHSHARLTYELVNEMVTDKASPERGNWGKVVDQLDQLYALFVVLDDKRKAGGTVDFEFPEPFIEYDDEQKIKRISIRERNSAHKMIEEFMLCANVCAAQFLGEHYKQNAIYRNHSGPKSEVLVDLRKFLSGFGLSLGGGDEPVASDYAQIVKQAVHQPEIFQTVQSALLRSLGQAVYSTEQLGHFALAYPTYTHFTSPIRRYSDLVVHRQIKLALQGPMDKMVAPQNTSLESVAEHCSFSERRAEDASREVMSWLKAEYMQDKVGEEFDGVISSVREFGLFVQLDDVFVDGLVHVSSLGSDYFHYDPTHFQLVGERTGTRFRNGAKIRVRVSSVNLAEAKIDFDLVSTTVSEARKTRQPDKKIGKDIPSKRKNQFLEKPGKVLPLVLERVPKKVPRKTRKPPRNNRRDSGNEDRGQREKSAENEAYDIAYGFHSVEGIIENDAGRLIEVIIDSSRFDQREKRLVESLRRQNVRHRNCDKEELESYVEGEVHQGVVALLTPRRTEDESDLENYLKTLDHQLLILILDQIQDPHNLGACIRTADGAGVDAVIVPKNGACPINQTVRKVAAGAVDRVRVFYVTNLSRTLEDLQQIGVWITGTTDKTDNQIYDCDLTGNVAIAMGSEGKGLRRLTQEKCDHLARIPMHGSVSSLNVSVATGVCLFEAVRQRTPKK